MTEATSAYQSVVVSRLMGISHSVYLYAPEERPPVDFVQGPIVDIGGRTVPPMLLIVRDQMFSTGHLNEYEHRIWWVPKRYIQHRCSEHLRRSRMHPRHSTRGQGQSSPKLGLVHIHYVHGVNGGSRDQRASDTDLPALGDLIWQCRRQLRYFSYKPERDHTISIAGPRYTLMRNGDQHIDHAEPIYGNANEPDSFPSEFLAQRDTSCPHQPPAEGGCGVDTRWESSSTFGRA
jgi:hypothetical protein